MPPRSPLPMFNGLDAAWVRTFDTDAEPVRLRTMGEFLHFRLAGAPVAKMLSENRFVNQQGQVLKADDPYKPNYFIWYHRNLSSEAEVPGELVLLYRDERILVVDKPHFLATIPRGRHITQSALVRARLQFGLPELTVAHRLDRLTAGILMFTIKRKWRGVYQTLFEKRLVTKTYQAVATLGPQSNFPINYRSRITKRRGLPQADNDVDSLPNSYTKINLIEQRKGLGRYLLQPVTGKTHQLRIHMAALGMPILNDPLYPKIKEIADGDFSFPLQLVASRLEFKDPVDGTFRRFKSTMSLDW